MSPAALCRAELDPRIRFGRSSIDLAVIVEAGVSLAVWERPPPVRIGSLRGFRNVRVAAQPSALAAIVAECCGTGPVPQWREQLAADVQLLAYVYADIMARAEVEIRLERVTTDACWRYHADYTAARLITTYAGRGTQWLDEAGAAILASGGVPVPFDLSPGAVGLFKGRLLSPENAIIHRSPPIAAIGEDRLLLVIDAPSDKGGP